MFGGKIIHVNHSQKFNILIGTVSDDTVEQFFLLVTLSDSLVGKLTYFRLNYVPMTKQFPIPVCNLLIFNESLLLMLGIEDVLFLSWGGTTSQAFVKVAEIPLNASSVGWMCRFLLCLEKWFSPNQFLSTIRFQILSNFWDIFYPSLT